MRQLTGVDQSALCTWAELFSAHAKIRKAALQIAEVSEASPELQKLAAEVMTMASVTEIVAHSVRDELEIERRFR